MPERPIKVRHVTSTYPRTVLRVDKTWPEPCVVLGSTPTSAIETSAPDHVVVPLYENMGPVSQRLAAKTLRRAASIPVDLFLVEVVGSSGTQGYGMLAVPRAVEPRFLVEEG